MTSVRVSLRLALSFLGVGARRGESNARKSLYGAIAGIGISLVPLIVVLVVSDGMIEGITSRLIDLSSSHIRVVDYTGTNGFDGGSDSAEGIEAIAAGLTSTRASKDGAESIREALPEREGTALVVGKNGRVGGTVRAVHPDFFRDDGDTRKLVTVIAGQATLESPNDAILGKKIAQDLGVGEGDSFRVLTMMMGRGGRAVPRFTTFTVRGVVSSGYQELDALWVFIPFRTGCRILPGESSNTFISVRIDDPFGDIERERLRVLESLPEGFRAYTWKEMNRSQFHSFTTTRTLLLFIMFMILFVAAINISSALVMMVMERRKEIAILKSVGADPSCVSSAFLLAGFFTGIGGILIGMPIGILCAVHINGLFAAIEHGINALMFFAYEMTSPLRFGNALPFKEIRLLDPAYYLESIPVTLRFGELFRIAAGALLLSVLVSVLPAARAGREKPLDTLRKS